RRRRAEGELTADERHSAQRLLAHGRELPSFLRAALYSEMAEPPRNESDIRSLPFFSLQSRSGPQQGRICTESSVHQNLVIHAGGGPQATSSLPLLREVSAFWISTGSDHISGHCGPMAMISGAMRNVAPRPGVGQERLAPFSFFDPGSRRAGETAHR